ncbi:cytidylyltransferase [Bacteroides xylanisolvens]|uniref:Cytidylyltransferase n=1 Tax=Bacteroides xylanisolvens TaxID=371601 RepID=A0A415HFX2_9BACE|nr:NTP transferase domain-containing protein [Bacteroides xylanisolvens]RHK91526.1 cytidylyltransferase [Bacteroides xylanisolvens]
MKIKALIAARSGSVRVENKNIRPFAESTLLEIKIDQLKRLSNLDGVVVNSNDCEILSIAEKKGVEVIKREPYYASNTVSMSDVYANMAENMDSDVIVYANCTNPLIKDETIFDIIEFYKNNTDKFDSVNSAHLIKEFLFKDNLPINYDLRYQPRSQDLPNISALNFAVNVISKEKMIECKNVVGIRPYIYNIDQIEATDIDNPIDFEFSEFVYLKTKTGTR